jgi:hypothetical protein
MITGTYKGYDSYQENLKRQGLRLVNLALLDRDFEERWCNEVCTENKGMTQMQILNKLREDINIQFRAYRRWWSKVVGYFVSGNVIWTNLKYVDRMTAVESGSNDLHECAHVKGFSHYRKWDSSVPYCLNRVFESWAKAYIAKQAPKAAVESVVEG